jgi:hypothetical protein
MRMWKTYELDELFETDDILELMAKCAVSDEVGSS